MAGLTPSPIYKRKHCTWRGERLNQATQVTHRAQLPQDLCPHSLLCPTAESWKYSRAAETGKFLQSRDMCSVPRMPFPRPRVTKKQAECSPIPCGCLGSAPLGPTLKALGSCLAGPALVTPQTRGRSKESPHRLANMSFTWAQSQLAEESQEVLGRGSGRWAKGGRPTQTSCNLAQPGPLPGRCRLWWHHYQSWRGPQPA